MILIVAIRISNSGSSLGLFTLATGVRNSISSCALLVNEVKDISSFIMLMMIVKISMVPGSG